MAPWILLALLGLGAAAAAARGGPCKGCLHGPRALWLCSRLLQNLEAEA